MQVEPDDHKECVLADATIRKAFFALHPWPLGIVPYANDLAFPVAERLITRAISAWAEKTKIRFIERTDEHAYVIFSRRGRCSATAVGYTGHPITLHVGGCGVIGAWHELGHALGLWHEHTRPDRDDHLIVHWENIESRAKGQFTKRTGESFGPIDWKSIMLYTRGAFSKNGQATMSPKDPTVVWLRNTEISDLDAAGVDQLHRLEYEKRDGLTPPEPEPEPEPEPPSNKLLELHGGRFFARLWYGPPGASRRAAVAVWNASSGVFSFFRVDDWEVLVTIRDGRQNNGHWWVTVGAATDLEWTLEITRRGDGLTWTADNTTPTPIVDINAFWAG